MGKNTGVPIHSVLRIVLGGIFLWASWDKIAQPEAFAGVIGNYQLLPEAMVPLVAIVLPWTEAVCGICLVTGIWAGGAALIINMLVVVFIAALSMNLLRGIDVNCGCFSVDGASAGSTPLEIGRDVVILAMGIVVLIGEIRAHSAQRGSAP